MSVFSIEDRPRLSPLLPDLPPIGVRRGTGRGAEADAGASTAEDSGVEPEDHEAGPPILVESRRVGHQEVWFRRAESLTLAASTVLSVGYFGNPTSAFAAFVIVYLIAAR